MKSNILRENMKRFGTKNLSEQKDELETAAAIGGIGLLLLLDKNIFYSGIAFGIAIREFLLAFKK